MNRHSIATLAGLIISLTLFPQQIKTPEEFLGYVPGTRFTLQHAVTDYIMHIAEASPSVQYIQYGESWEGRPLGVCVVSSPGNLEQLEQIRLSNLQRSGLADGTPVTAPVPIVWLAYTVHGSEPAGTEAALKVLWTLAAGEWKDADRWLENMVIVIDPCQNPDGRELFTTRYIRAQGWPPNSDPNAWEHNQPWPSARLNHYLFDLNRDWSWHVQQETQMRMKLYNSFMPHVHADFHEMGSGSTYFFPPGAEPWHEVITPWQREYHTLTGKKASGLFDATDRLYFTKDNFDLFCPSFGDTWPLFNGAMGFTLEQGGGAQAGLVLKRLERDTLTLADRIEGHFLASMAVIEAAADNSDRLLTEFFQFFKSGAEKPSSKYKSFIIKGSADAASLRSLLLLLESNQIRYSSPRVTGKKITAYDYRADREGSVTVEENDILISAYQPQSRLLQVLFEPDSRSSDSISYDLTAWALPYVYNIEAYAVEERLPSAGDAPDGKKRSGHTVAKPNQTEETATSLKEPGDVAAGSKKTGKAVESWKQSGESYASADASGKADAGQQSDTVRAYAYAVPMTGFNELKFMAQLYRAGFNVRSALRPFTAAGSSFGRGSVVVARGDNRSMTLFDEKVMAAAVASGVTPVKLAGGMSATGKDLGSDYTRVGQGPVIALVGGEGTSQAFGEIWFYMERELEYPVTVIDGTMLKNSDLSDYDLLILPGGNLKESKDKIMAFVTAGGRVIAMDSAITLFREEKTTELGKAWELRQAEEKKKTEANPADTSRLVRYEDQRRVAATGRSAGAIYRVKLDETHPYAFGMGEEWFLMKRNEGLPYLEKGSNIGYITDEDPVAGFAGYKFRKKVRNTGVIASENIGRGSVVYLSDDPYFRAYWKSGRVLLGNLFLR
jgi:hypothetical protein